MTDRGERAIDRMRDGETIDFSAVTMRVTLEIVGKTLFVALRKILKKHEGPCRSV